MTVGELRARFTGAIRKLVVEILADPTPLARPRYEAAFRKLAQDIDAAFDGAAAKLLSTANAATDVTIATGSTDAYDRALDRLADLERLYSLRGELERDLRISYVVALDVALNPWPAAAVMVRDFREQVLTGRSLVDSGDWLKYATRRFGTRTSPPQPTGGYT